MATTSEPTARYSSRPEKTLWLFALLGGAPGGWLGMRTFHHKTRHWYFRYGFPLLAALDAALLLWLRLG